VIERLANPDLLLITPRRIEDARGAFWETLRHDALSEALGAPAHFVQENQSFSRHAGTVRGLHFQTPPFAQAKLVRCLAGAIFDVAVDLRPTSPHYLRAAAIHLDGDRAQSLFIPAGFAHGFATLTDAVHVLYHVSAPYAPSHDVGVAFDDPAFEIDWPVTRAQAHLSARDAAALRYHALPEALRRAFAP
jgi:dTDP-4-dehydrorhamnose 3,5-epimerase